MRGRTDSDFWRLSWGDGNWQLTLESASSRGSTSLVTFVFRFLLPLQPRQTTQSTSLQEASLTRRRNRGGNGRRLDQPPRSSVRVHSFGLNFVLGSSGELSFSRIRTSVREADEGGPSGQLGS